MPTEDKIAEAVKKLRRNRSGGASRIRAEHLKGWLTAAKRGELAEEKGEEKTEAEEEGGELWGKLVEITQTSFREGKLAEEATWQTVVLIPKWKRGFRGDWVGGGHLEGHGGDPTSPAHGRDQVSRCAARIPGGLPYWDGHPRGQAAPVACSLEGGIPIRDLLQPDQGI